MRIEGDGLVLRPWTDDDLAAMPSIYDDPDVARFTPIESPFDAGAALRYLAKVRARGADGSAVHRAITTDGGTPLGEVMLFERPDGFGVDGGTLRTREIGYAVAPAARGRRLASRAVRLVADHAARTLGTQRLVLRIDDGHVASERVATACGFTRVALDPGDGTRHWERGSAPTTAQPEPR